MEDILIVSNYYPPEKGAAANRIEQLALKLSQHNYNVSVVCPLANYPEGRIFPEHRRKFTAKEQRDGINVKRLWIYPSNSKNIVVRIFSILSFTFGLLLYLMFGKTSKKVIVQSPPLLLSFTSVCILRLLGKKIILNVSDLWPLAAIELGALKKNSMSHKASLFLEKTIYKKASVIIGQSDEIISHIQSIAHKTQCYLYRNYPDHELHITELPQRQYGTIKLFYAGLLGVAQGVLEVCQRMELANLNIEFHIFGDGAEKKEIMAYIKAHPEKNIAFEGMIPRTELISRLQGYDIAIVPLKKRIYGSVPSKIFEYSALGLPILYFGGGEGNTIVNENKLGWVAEVGDFDALNKMLVHISEMDRAELEDLKKKVFGHSAQHFNLESQIAELKGKDVF